MTSYVKKSRLRFLRYALFLLQHEFLHGDSAQKQRFVRRWTHFLLGKLGLLSRRKAWINIVRVLENGDELTSWLTDRKRPHILVLGSGSIGDILQITPVLRALREKIPTAQIAVLHSSLAVKTVLKNNPYIDSVASADLHTYPALVEAVRTEGTADLVVEIRSMSFILTYTRAPTALRHADFHAALSETFFDKAEAVRLRWQAPHGYQKPEGTFTWPQEWRHMTYLDVLGMLSNLPVHAHSKLDFFPDREPITHDKTFSPLPEGTPFITVQAGVDTDVMNWAEATRQRPTKLLPLETWQKIVHNLTDKGFAVIQLGSALDEAIKGVTQDLRGKTTLSQAALILGEAFCHLGTEGGLVHLARAMDIKSVVMFGPTSADFLGYPDNINVTAGDCSGCWGATKDWYIYCPRGLAEAECMNAFSAEAIVAAIDRLAPQPEESPKSPG